MSQCLFKPDLNSTFRNGPDHQLAQASLCSAKVAGNQPGNLVDNRLICLFLVVIIKSFDYGGTLGYPILTIFDPYPNEKS